MKEGDKVLVPRTSGDFTPGAIVFVYGEKALVEFPIGFTCQPPITKVTGL